MTDALHKVRITSIPHGEAPEWVRRAWIGIELPDSGMGPTEERKGLVTGRLTPSRSEDLLVSARVAVAALKEKNPKAAIWFEQNIDLELDLLFYRSEVTPIPNVNESASHLPIEEWDPIKRKTR